ncbi:hypothetical protein M885DRAFT_622408 [Pelagophyceae sp. CCMP2097]|nr:hypothetical protein M885DRAFT_622408 [Pelagophyceae sp. CCMP2097]|mmetsp:Transcript_22706/g.76714  ORF Transcript_22706/g.76714 Transcript_22706/m.76714 type:complete len:251 (+) Transcript_22706:37-789(+)
MSQLLCLGALVAVRCGGFTSTRPAPRHTVLRADVAVAETTDAAAPAALENAPFPSLIEGMEIFLESAIDGAVEGRGGAFLFKMRATVPGAAVLSAFDAVREKAKANLKEPGYRPGDVPPWIKTQLVEFSLTTVMEDVVKETVEAHGLAICSGDSGEETVKWIENPSEEAKTYVMGSAFDFHASFNATLPVEPLAESAGASSISSLYKLTAPMIARADRILADKGRVPGLLSKVSSSSKKAPAKKGGGKKR